MAITVKVLGLNNTIKSQILNINKIAGTHIERLAKETESVLKTKITDSLQRPGSTGNLANNMFAEKIGILSWGVGNISVLNQKAPYWRWINYGVAASGRTTPPATSGRFSPGNPAPSSDSFRAGRFSQGEGGFLMIPQKPIQAHNFIERTTAEIPNIVQRILGRKI